MRTASDLLQTNFGQNWIGNTGPAKWLLLSSGLAPLYFFICGYIKDILYQETYNNKSDLKQAIVGCIDSISGIQIRNSMNSIQRGVIYV